MTDIETAIEITQRQIEELKSNLPTLVTQEYYDSFNLAIEVKQKAIQALQEKAEREKGCEYCKDEKSMPTGNKNTGFYLAGEALTYTAQAAADDDFEDNTFVNYCPMCGRKL